MKNANGKSKWKGTDEESEWISEWLQLRSSGRDEGGVCWSGNSCPCAVSMSSSGDTDPISSSEDSSIPWLCRLEINKSSSFSSASSKEKYLSRWRRSGRSDVILLAFCVQTRERMAMDPPVELIHSFVLQKSDEKKKRVRISYLIIYQFNYLLIPFFFWIWLLRDWLSCCYFLRFELVLEEIKVFENAELLVGGDGIVEFRVAR